MERKNGKVALITGANKGLGKELAQQLALLGYTKTLFHISTFSPFTPHLITAKKYSPPLVAYLIK